MGSIKETLVAAIAVVIFYFVVMYLVGGCRPILETTAEATYLGQQLECVDNLPTKEDIDGCRASVKRRWAKDAGKDGAK